METPEIFKNLFGLMLGLSALLMTKLGEKQFQEEQVLEVIVLAIDRQGSARKKRFLC